MQQWSQCLCFLPERSKKEGKPAEIYDGSVDLTPWDLAAAWGCNLVACHEVCEDKATQPACSFHMFSWHLNRFWLMLNPSDRFKQSCSHQTFFFASWHGKWWRYVMICDKMVTRWWRDGDRGPKEPTTCGRDHKHPQTLSRQRWSSRATKKWDAMDITMIKYIYIYYLWHTMAIMAEIYRSADMFLQKDWMVDCSWGSAGHSSAKGHVLQRCKHVWKHFQELTKVNRGIQRICVWFVLTLSLGVLPGTWRKLTSATKAQKPLLS